MAREVLLVSGLTSMGLGAVVLLVEVSRRIWRKVQRVG